MTTTIGGTKRGQFALGLVIGSPTGGDKGAGTINAQAVYDDNAFLSCYVFDQARSTARSVLKNGMRACPTASSKGA